MNTGKTFCSSTRSLSDLVSETVCKLRHRAIGIVLLSVVFPVGAMAQVDIAQQPLTVGENVPGHLVLTPSVEWPTVLSMANVGSYSTTTAYAGYFDSGKCYEYVPDADAAGVPFASNVVRSDSKGYFHPVGYPGNKGCDGDWSGHLLNWFATQTIDTFRSALTGGYRVVDESDMTVLEKARHTGQSGTGDRQVSGNKLLPEIAPFDTDYLLTRIKGLNNQMYFAISGVDKGNNPYVSPDTLRGRLNSPDQVEEYDPSTSVEPGVVYSVNIDVEVCVDGLLEGNCVAYGNNHKPEGLIQEYGQSFTYSVFGYFNTDDHYKDGAPLRVAKKFVGPTTFDPISGVQNNSHKEWDPDTGVLFDNPDAASQGNSGLINYINKFGQTVDADLKSYDPVSEMYYAAIRYLKGQSAVDSYGDDNNLGTTDRAYDGFPVVRDWDDPRQYWCENDFILGIGDVNTWDDKNLPGSTDHGREPSTPTEVENDDTVDVSAATAKVAELEGITINTPFTGRENSAYIAGLAYDSHTQDMRPLPDDPSDAQLQKAKNDQTVSTYWVDVMENQVLRNKSNNQYWLAAKYGGFTVPDDFDPDGASDALPESWWHTNGDTLSTGDLRPDNFFTGGNAVEMKEALRKAFSAIASANIASRTSPAVNSTALESDSAVYQATYKEGEWSGTLKAYPIDSTTGQVSAAAAWSASGSRLDPTSSDGFFTANNGSLVAFSDTNVSSLSAEQVAYLRGSAEDEEQNGGDLRDRSNTLGDIVNSSPVYVGAPNVPVAPAMPNRDEFAGDMSGYADRASVVYVAANDGFLHAFDAETGAEKFAYVPSTLLSGDNSLASYAEPDYGSANNPHRYFNDGQVSIATVYANGAWRTVLAGSTGRGEARTIYALDVTDPENPALLWEKTDTHIGQIVGRPVIAQTASGEWSVLVGNGYNSDYGEAALLEFDVWTGDLTVHAVDGSGTLGLSAPGVPITDTGTGVSSLAYAGDAAGNLWRFDLSGSTASTGELVFSAGSAKPITSEILVGKNPLDGNWWAFFGTGKYVAVSDLSSTGIQTWYGLKLEGDNVSFPLSADDLVNRAIVYQADGSGLTQGTRIVSPGSPGDMDGKLGWQLDLVYPANATTGDGERMVTRNQFKNGLLVGATLIPETSDPCAPTGSGWVMAVNPFTGANPSGSFFDLNGDGSFDDQDLIDFDGESVPAAGISFDSLAGIPAFIGNRMIVNVGGDLQDSSVGGSVGDGRRTSWREIVTD